MPFGFPSVTFMRRLTMTIQKYTAVADENAAKYAAKYEEFIKSHTPLQIKEANAARRKLAKLRGTKARILHDERQVKTPRNAFTFFLTEKGAVKEKFASLAEEWKSASDTEKEVRLQTQLVPYLLSLGDSVIF